MNTKETAISINIGTLGAGWETNRDKDSLLTELENIIDNNVSKIIIEKDPNEESKMITGSITGETEMGKDKDAEIKTRQDVKEILCKQLALLAETSQNCGKSEKIALCALSETIINVSSVLREMLSQ